MTVCNIMLIVNPKSKNIKINKNKNKKRSENK